MPTTGATGYEELLGTAPGGAVTDFPLYLRLNLLGVDWWNAFDAAGADPGRIRVTTDAGVELPRDPINVQSNANGTGNGTLRIMYSGALSSAPTLRIYPDATGTYGDSDTYGRYNVYNAATLAYYPLNDDPSGAAPQMQDRTANSNHGTTAGSMTSGDSVAAVLDDGLDLDGSNDYVSTVDPGGPAQLTVQLWAYSHVTQAHAPLGSNDFNISGSDREAVTIFDNNGTFWGRMRIGGVDVTVTGGAWDPSTWYHVALTYDGSSLVLYVDGSLVASAAASGSVYDSQIPINIGRRGDYSTYWYYNGIVDDVHVSTAGRSADWIAYEYTQTFENDAFWNWAGTWNTVGGGGGEEPGGGEIPPAGVDMILPEHLRARFPRV